MDVFKLRNGVVGEYEAYARGFMRIKDEKIKSVVEKGIEDGLICPPPIVQLNPAYASGDSFDKLVAEDVLDRRCRDYFVDRTGKPLKFYKHQTEAFRRARNAEHYVLTTGTGSGKSLAYIVPIVDHILRTGSGQGVKAIVVYPMNALVNSQYEELKKFLERDGRKPPVTYAIYTGQESQSQKQDVRENPPDVILTNYMMLELILTRSDEAKLVKKFNELRFLVFDELHTYRGRQGADVAMLARRVVEASRSNHVLRVGTSATLASGISRDEDRREVARVAYAIFGADVKPENVIVESLDRETKELDFNDPEERRQLQDETRRLAEFADALAKRSEQPDDDQLLAAFADVLADASPLAAIQSSRLAAWIESQIGVARENGDGEFVRLTPKPIKGENGCAVELAKTLELDPKSSDVLESCARAIEIMLLCGAKIKNEFGRTFFAFKLHQFVGRGENAHATAELGEDRQIYMQRQVFAPNSNRTKRIYPLAFCSRCGQEFYCVHRREPKLVKSNDDDAPKTTWFEARDPGEPVGADKDEKENVGFLYLHPDQTLEDREFRNKMVELVPPEWKDDEGAVKSDRKKDLPQPYRINLLGEVVPPEEDGVRVSFIHSPFRFCPECGVAYDPQSSRAGGDVARVSSFNVGGRSASTTILALGVERMLLEFFPKLGDGSAADDENRKQRKLLSFTDNRQDASLQAGHFNDFVQVSVLRGALYRALEDADDAGLNLTEVVNRLIEVLDLRYDEYLLDPTPPKGTRSDKVKDLLKKSLRYRLACDLRRGWRILLPNLEQTGLVEIDYLDLDDLARDVEGDVKGEEWLRAHETLVKDWSVVPAPSKRAKETKQPDEKFQKWLDKREGIIDVWRDAFVAANPGFRAQILRALLDYMRTNLAIDVDELIRSKQDDMLREIKNTILPEWGFDESDATQSLKSATAAVAGSTKNSKDGNDLPITGAGSFGRYLRLKISRELGLDLERDDVTYYVVPYLLRVCAGGYGLLKRTPENRMRFRINSDNLLWKKGNGIPRTIDVWRTFEAEDKKDDDRANKYFTDFYKTVASKIGRLKAREHTAQVPSDLRREREAAFRAGNLPILFCSPTMELGVDIAELNVVHMRNIPPTPANYAQRSGRAGRSGQSALALAFCSPFNQHDRYYFSRPHLVVSGAVKPPQIDLENEDLLKAHARSIWMTTAAKRNRFSLGGAMTDAIVAPSEGEKTNDPSEFKINPNLSDAFRDESIKAEAFKRIRDVLSSLPKFEGDFQPNDAWIEKLLAELETDFATACQRWIDLFIKAREQKNVHNKRMNDASFSKDEREDSKRIHRQAANEIDILQNTSRTSGQDKIDEKSEFYPYRYFAAEGFLPGYNFPRLPVLAYLPDAEREPNAYLQRARFLAISEFAPNALIYHEGARYRIERANLPLVDRNSTTGELTTTVARLCPRCGYYHEEESGADVCELCNAQLSGYVRDLLEMTKVTARRRDRINCDEEERLRLGYEVEAAYRFANRDGRVSARSARIKLADGTDWGKMTYGDGAKIYRINQGYRSGGKSNGFAIDCATGRWVSDSKENEEKKEKEEGRAPTPMRTKRVRPFVSDTKNCLVVEPKSDLKFTVNELLSLSAALKRAIERTFYIEESELAVFPLPSADPRMFLFYEASEGGAGVLRRLLDREKFLAVVREALEVCHYDTEKMEDCGYAVGSKERCEAACYDCLLSYSNQIDHGKLDRQLAIKRLLPLLDASFELSPTPSSREEHLAELEHKTGSKLEDEWLDFIKKNKFNLPSHAQYGRFIESVGTVPDFVYAESRLAIFIDGPAHDSPEQASKDAVLRKRLHTQTGWDVLVFRHDDKERWLQIALEEFSYVFRPKER